MNNELNEYEQSCVESPRNGSQSALSQNKRPKDKHAGKMLGIMNEYYTHIKEVIGIDVNYEPDEDDPELDKVLQEMRPNSTATNFRPFLGRSANFDRNTPWKQISRKVNDDDQKRRVWSSAGRHSQAINSGQTTRPGNVGNLFNQNTIGPQNQAQELDTFITNLDRKKDSGRGIVINPC